MKKLFALGMLCVFCITSNAQVKVITGGNVCVGSTTSTPNKPLVIAKSGGMRILQTANIDSTNEIVFQDNGQIRSYDNSHRIIFDRASGGSSHDIMELREYGAIYFSPGSTGGTRTQKVTFTSGGLVGIGTTSPQRDLVVSNGGAEGTEIKAYTGYTQIISYKRTTTVGYIPLVLQDAAGGNVGIGTTTPSTKLYVNGTSNLNGAVTITGATTITGNVTVIGNGTYSGTWVNSDQMFKTNIDSISNSLSIIRQLKPKTYFMDTVNFNKFNFDSRRQYGFLAQELEQVLPELVRSNTTNELNDSSGNVVRPALTSKTVNYIELIGILTKGIQELDRNESKLDSIIDAQNEKIDALQNQIIACCNNPRTQTINNSNNTGNGIEGSGTNSNEKTSTVPLLYQNAPNPFNEQTIIQYFIPINSSVAKILIFDLNGKLLNTISITSFGKGSITINGKELNPGMFVYSLIVDGKEIDTKRMILTK